MGRERQTPWRPPLDEMHDPPRKRGRGQPRKPKRLDDGSPRLTKHQDTVMKEIVRLYEAWVPRYSDWPPRGLASRVAKNVGCRPQVVGRYLREPTFREEFWRRMPGGDVDHLLARLENADRDAARDARQARASAEKLLRALWRAKRSNT